MSAAVHKLPVIERSAKSLEYLGKLTGEIIDELDNLVRTSPPVHGSGTSAGNYGSLRITTLNYNTARDQDELTHLMTVRMALAETAVVDEDDKAVLRRRLITLAATTVKWLEDLDSE